MALLCRYPIQTNFTSGEAMCKNLFSNLMMTLVISYNLDMILMFMYK